MQPISTEIYKVDWRGRVTLSANLCTRFHMTRGSFVVAQELEDAILIYPAQPNPTRHFPEHLEGFIIPGETDQIRLKWRRLRRQKLDILSPHDTKENK